MTETGTHRRTTRETGIDLIEFISDRHTQTPREMGIHLIDSTSELVWPFTDPMRRLHTCAQSIHRVTAETNIHSSNGSAATLGLSRITSLESLVFSAPLSSNEWHVSNNGHYIRCAMIVIWHRTEYIFIMQKVPFSNCCRVTVVFALKLWRKKHQYKAAALSKENCLPRGLCPMLVIYIMITKAIVGTVIMILWVFFSFWTTHNFEKTVLSVLEKNGTR